VNTRESENDRKVIECKKKLFKIEKKLT